MNTVKLAVESTTAGATMSKNGSSRRLVGSSSPEAGVGGADSQINHGLIGTLAHLGFCAAQSAATSRCSSVSAADLPVRSRLSFAAQPLGRSSVLSRNRSPTATVRVGPENNRIDVTPALASSVSQAAQTAAF